MDNLFVFFEPVRTWWMRWIGRILGGKIPLHSQVYWIQDGKCFMTELTDDPVALGGIVVGKGDGYEVQITPVPNVQGNPVPCDDLDAAIRAMKEYASIENGDLNGTECDRHWYDQPQGYGGPMYGDPCTCNTFSRWVLSHGCKCLPPVPEGAVGWDHVPKFPGPPLNDDDMQPE